MSEIRFGTSGWRAVIARDFTFDAVRLVSRAIALHLKNHGHHGAEVVVGYDTRFMGDLFALESAKVLKSEGLEPVLSSRDLPTPVVAHEIIRRGAAGGVNITASHNPPEYSGIKFSPARGCPAPVEVTMEIEEIIGDLKGMKTTPAGGSDSQVPTCDFAPAYCRRLKELVDFDLLARNPARVAYNALWGTGRGYVDTLLREAGWQVNCLHCKLNPGFGGRRPEPDPAEMPDFMGLFSGRDYTLGFATDGDADRYGIVDSSGEFIPPNTVLALLFHYLVSEKGREGGVARSVATSHLVDRVAMLHHRPVYETPVGFKYIAEYVLDGSIAIGGEESAGLTLGDHVPEKDGILACLLVAEMVTARGCSLAQVREELFSRVGPLFSKRVNIPLTGNREVVEERLSSAPGSFAGVGVKEVVTTDGTKLLLDDGSWVLFRLSGTEPVARFYAEAESEERLAELVAQGNRFLSGQD